MATETRANFQSGAAMGYIVDGIPDALYSALGPIDPSSRTNTAILRTLPDSSTLDFNVTETTFTPYAQRANHPQYALMVDLSTGTNATVTFIFVQAESY